MPTRRRRPGLRIPDDLSVVGFDDQELIDRSRPGLTTVALPHYEMGEWAARHCRLDQHHTGTDQTGALRARWSAAHQ